MSENEPMDKVEMADCVVGQCPACDATVTIYSSIVGLLPDEIAGERCATHHWRACELHQQIRGLDAEVIRLRARLAEVERERDEARANAMRNAEAAVNATARAEKAEAELLPHAMAYSVEKQKAEAWREAYAALQARENLYGESDDTEVRAIARLDAAKAALVALGEVVP